jgi:hypothetical protein
MNDHVTDMKQRSDAYRNFIKAYAFSFGRSGLEFTVDGKQCIYVATTPF